MICLDQNRLIKDDNEVARMFSAINSFCKKTVDGRIYCCDGLCMAAAIDPSIVTSSRQAYGEVSTEGKHTTGGIFYNMYPDYVKAESTPNVTIILEVDHDAYIDMLEKSLGLGNASPAE